MAHEFGMKINFVLMLIQIQMGMEGGRGTLEYSKTFTIQERIREISRVLLVAVRRGGEGGGFCP